MSNLILALQITALGMGLVFAIIILIWWMMALLTSFTAEKESPPKVMAPESPIEDEKARAAAIAVAIAITEHQLSQSPRLPLPPTAIVSAWQLGTRTRQLSEKRMSIVRNPRRVG